MKQRPSRNQHVEHSGTGIEDPRTVRIVMGSCLVGAALAAAVMFHTTKAHGQDASPSYWFNLYAAPRYTGDAAMRFKFKAGPFPDLAICYTLGAIAIEALNDENPDKDFMGGCERGEILTLRQVADRALALLPKDGTRR